MTEERLTDGERQALIDLILRTLAKAKPDSYRLKAYGPLLRKLEGVDTVVLVRKGA